MLGIAGEAGYNSILTGFAKSLCHKNTPLDYHLDLVYRTVQAGLPIKDNHEYFLSQQKVSDMSDWTKLKDLSKE